MIVIKLLFYKFAMNLKKSLINRYYENILVVYSYADLSFWPQKSRPNRYN